MAARMERTRTPGIYKRGSRYVFVYKVNGRQKKESTRTYDEARRMKAARQADIARGEFHEQTRTKFCEYAEEWVERYQGRGSHGFRESTRDDYRRDFARYAFPFFDEKLGRRVSQISPRDVANFVAWLCDEEAQRRRADDEAKRLSDASVKAKQRGDGDEARRLRKRAAVVNARSVRLSDATVRRILAPVRACLGTAMQEGLVRHNPTRGAALPHRPGPEDDGRAPVRVFTAEQLAVILGVVHDRYQLLFRFLAATGVRISEAIGLEWRHLELDGSRAHVKIRQARVRGRLGPPKSRHARRDVPLPQDLVFALREHRRSSAWAGEHDVVFAAANGAPLRPGNVQRRYLRPAAEEAGAPWAGFHEFRHTCASMLFDRGANAVQVQHWLGHHSPAFTMATYVHLLPGNLGEPLDVAARLEVANPVATEPTGIDRNGDGPAEALPVAMAPSEANSPPPQQPAGIPAAES